jgi:hypothetical protein
VLAVNVPVLTFMRVSEIVMVDDDALKVPLLHKMEFAVRAALQVSVPVYVLELTWATVTAEFIVQPPFLDPVNFATSPLPGMPAPPTPVWVSDQLAELFHVEAVVLIQ